MKRLFYRDQDKLFFDTGAFIQMVQDYRMNPNDVYRILGINSKYKYEPRLIEI